MRIDAENLYYKELNRMIREGLKNGENEFILENVNGQRYIGDGLSGSAKIIINGVPGNDLAAFMNGLTVFVNGNCQDATGNTMNSGKIIVKGDAGDVIAHSMRGGRIFIRGSAGYRVGIHMKEFEAQKPVVVIGGCVGDFFGEYMAGGVLVLLGLGAGRDSDKHGDFLATGMHGGKIYIRADRLDPFKFGKEIRVFEVDEEDKKFLKELLGEYADDMSLNFSEIISHRFLKLLPVSKNPYGNLYTH